MLIKSFLTSFSQSTVPTCDKAFNAMNRRSNVIYVQTRAIPIRGNLEARTIMLEDISLRKFDIQEIPLKS